MNIHKAQARTGVGAKYGLSRLQADTPRRQLTHTTHQDTISGTLHALLLAGAAAKGNAVVSHPGLMAGNISQPDRGGRLYRNHLRLWPASSGKQASPSVSKGPFQIELRSQLVSWASGADGMGS